MIPRSRFSRTKAATKTRPTKPKRKQPSEVASPKKSKVKKVVILDKIADAVEYGNLGILIGAGLPMAIFNQNQKRALSWPELLEKCAKILKVDFGKVNKPGVSHPEMATQICKMYSKKTGFPLNDSVLILKQQIADLTSFYPNPSTRARYNEFFDVLKPKWALTTNYDTVLESILTGKGHSLAPADFLSAPTGQMPIYHLHGSRLNPSSIVITQQDYVELLRPNHYRQLRLSLLMTESLTLLIGYRLGDVNVQTAVDWSRNVYKRSRESKHNFPNDLIQLVYSKRPRKEPYRDNHVLVIEFADLEDCLIEICEHIEDRQVVHKSRLRKLRVIEKRYLEPTPHMIDRFIETENARDLAIKHLKDNESFFINAFIEFLSRVLDNVWGKARENGGFRHYDVYLKLIFEIIEKVNFPQGAPALIQTLCSRLDKVAFFIGPGFGEANQAYKTWKIRAGGLRTEMKNELRNICRTDPDYSNLSRLLGEID